MDHLKNRRFIQVCGPSGVGKTTLMQKKLIHFRARGRSCLYLSQSIDSTVGPFCEVFPYTRALYSIARSMLLEIGRNDLVDCLSAKRARSIRRFSGGEGQLFRAAFMLAPNETVFADEPFSALDDNTRLRLEAYLYNFSAANRIIFTSHREFSQPARRLDLSPQLS